MKPKSISGVIISKRKPDGGKEELYTEGNEGDGLELHAEELIRAVQAKDPKAVAEAFRNAFEMLQQESGDEDSKAEPHSFDAQNRAAAE